LVAPVILSEAKDLPSEILRPSSGLRMTTLQAVLFDWDGTLLDSAEASYRCYVRHPERSEGSPP